MSDALRDLEKRLRGDLYEALMDHSRGSERSQQAAGFRVGVSDLGFCPERTRRMLDNQVPDETDELLAFIGTALGDHMERAWKRRYPEAIIQAEVTIQHRISVNGKSIQITLPGHPDIILPEDGILLDGKSDYGLGDIRRTGPTMAHQFQRHQYAKAAWEQGLFADHIDLEDVLVGNVYIDRAGIDRELHVDLERFDQQWVDAARDWLEDVVYHQVNDSEADKVPPREMCQAVCGFFATCRAYDTDVSGLITDPVTLERVRMYVEGLELAKQGERLKNQAKVHLEGVEGTTGEHMIRHTWINPSDVAYTRKGYFKLEVKPMPKPKAPR